MRGLTALIPLLICVVGVVPVLSAVTAESWSEGLFDPKPDDPLLANKSSDVRGDGDGLGHDGMESVGPYDPVVGPLLPVVDVPEAASSAGDLSSRAPPAR